MKNQSSVLKKLLDPKSGELILLKIRLQEISINEDNKSIFDTLLEVLAAVTSFQCYNHHKMDTIKSFYKENVNSEIFMAFGPLHGMIKKCGMDQYKSPKHHTFVFNHYHYKTSGFSLIGFKKNRPKLTNKNIFLATDLYNSPQRLSFVMRKASLSNKVMMEELAISPGDKAMVEELKKATRKFLKDYALNIIKHVKQLRAIHFA